MKHLVLLTVVLAIAPSASASTIIWEAFGEVTRTTYIGGFGDTIPPPEFGHFGPPVGTPYEIRLSFDPDARVQTPLHPAPQPCSMTAASGSMVLGGFSYNLTGNVFTNGLFPADNCSTGPAQLAPSIDFFLFPLAIGPTPWGLDGYLELKYWDLIFTGGLAFPTTPTYDRDGALYSHNFFFDFRGPFAPTVADIEQPAAVPEPGTMALLGTGLAYGLARRRRAHGAADESRKR